MLRFAAFVCLALAMFVASLSVASVRSPDAESAAAVRNFIRSSACTPTGVTTTFVLPSVAEIQAQHRRVPLQIWIDLTLFDNGFAPGTFIGAGPFAPGARFEWPGWLPGLNHHYRVNALFPEGWEVLRQGVFTTPDCGIVLRYDCHPGIDTVTIEFNVSPAYGIAGATPVEQWIDLSLRSLRFLTIESAAGPLPGTGARYSWPGNLPNRHQYFRINARYSGSFNGWRVQASGQFITPDCRLLPAGA